MIIYKITNIKNNKVYIGQTIRPMKDRFNRHINDALNNVIDTHFTRAIRKYGKESFIIEQIDAANSQQELNIKEQMWIREYDSTNKGYNETDAIFKCGGNTYKSKTKAEMKKIGKKLRKTKLGGLNPRSVKVIMIDITENKKQIFNSQQECANFLKLKSHVPISRRCRGIIKSPLDKKYMFEYYDE